MMKDQKRRSVLKGIWVAPIVTAITLPTHAQTSICSMTDLVGTWRFVSATHDVPALTPTFELFASGLTSDSASRWGITDDGDFYLEQDLGDFHFTAPLTSDCDNLSGTSTTRFTEPPFNLPPNGTWSAERI